MGAQLVLENVGVHLPSRTLFQGINWTLYSGTRVALAGRNGSGKSTLLKILSGQLDPTDGKCTRVGGNRLRVGYLDQSLLDSAVLEAKGKSSEAPAHYLNHYLERNGAEEGLDHEWRIRKALSGLGFSEESMDEPLGNLSGGWLLRMFIAGTLLVEPDVLLLDEPTNHLDLSSIQWLEEFLEKEFRGSLILVTHDVSLQKRTTDSLAVLHGGAFYFRSHQRDYLTFRASLEDEKRILEKNIDALTKKIDEHQEFVDKYKAKARIAARAQSKQRTIEELEEERGDLKERLARIEGFRYGLHFQFRSGDRGGKFPLAVKNMGFRYAKDAPWIVKNASLDIARGQRIAIIGDNGAGKTTFLNLLAGRVNPEEGEIQKGHNVDLGYFGQHQLDELSLNDTVLDNLREKAEKTSTEQLRGWLGAFGFHGDNDTGKKAKVLSGGERARLALLRILVTPVNLVLLDEPTNHLDIETKELLKGAIKSFEGTVVLVSHDREFVGDVADRILYYSLDHTLTDHIGTLKTFFEKYSHLVRHLDGVEKKSAPKPVSDYEERKKAQSQLRTLQKKIATVEATLSRLGEEKEVLETESGKPEFYDPANESRRIEVFAKIKKLEEEIRSAMVEWERLSTELE